MRSDLYGGGNSAVTSVPADFNAFDARNALYSIQSVLHFLWSRMRVADTILDHRYYGTIPSSVSDADGIAFIQGMKAAVEDNQEQTQFREYGALFRFNCG